MVLSFSAFCLSVVWVLLRTMKTQAGHDGTHCRRSWEQGLLLPPLISSLLTLQKDSISKCGNHKPLNQPSDENILLTWLINSQNNLGWKGLLKVLWSVKAGPALKLHKVAEVHLTSYRQASHWKAFCQSWQWSASFWQKGWALQASQKARWFP